MDAYGVDFELGDVDKDNEEEELSQSEDRPFIRKLQEMNMWRSLYKTTVICFLMTFFDFFNFEIYAPLLIFYFIVVTIFLCRVKLEHMIRYQYVPWNFGKTSYSK